jgi:ferritin-like metal-binding protein YciE
MNIALKRSTKDADEFIAWLRDAHSMETATIGNIKRILPHLAEFPDLAERYRVHIDESKEQAQRLEDALARFDAGPSTVKETAMRGLGVAESFVTQFTSDQPLKDCLAAYAYEQFECASYRSLIAGAKSLGENKMAASFQKSLEEEEDMASAIAENIPRLTEYYLPRSSALKTIAQPKNLVAVAGVVAAAALGATLLGRRRR